MTQHDLTQHDLTQHDLIDQTLADAMVAAATSGERCDLLLDYLSRNGTTNYDESVTQIAHALQSAALARAEGGTPALVVASLLHDLGHLLVDEHAAHGAFLEHDLGHEKVAANYLEPFLGPEVTEPIRLHVRAKRYLCTTRPDYWHGLSDSSKRSLEIQGGLLDDAEVAALEALPFLDDAVKLRLWDDRAKVEGLETPELEEFRSDLLELLG